MKNFLGILILIAGFCATAQADVWKWVDAQGNTHFVDTNKPIFTWVDDSGDAHYSDTPDHEDAVAVVLVWVSNGSLPDLGSAEGASGSGSAIPGETPEQQAAREKAQAYYCKRATEIYESYANAPRLYKTNGIGEREYLSEEEAAKTIAETLEQKEEHCSKVTATSQVVRKMPTSSGAR